MIIILKQKGTSQDANGVCENIQRALKIKGYELYSKTSSHVYYSKIISGVGSFGWDYFFKKVSVLNQGNIRIEKECAHILIYAHISSIKGLLFYGIALTLVSLLFCFMLDLSFIGASFFLA